MQLLIFCIATICQSTSSMRIAYVLRDSRTLLRSFALFAKHTVSLSLRFLSRVSPVLRPAALLALRRIRALSDISALRSCRRCLILRPSLTTCLPLRSNCLHSKSLCISMRFYAFLCVSMRFYAFLCISVSLADLSARTNINTHIPQSSRLISMLASRRSRLIRRVTARRLVLRNVLRL